MFGQILADTLNAHALIGIQVKYQPHNLCFVLTHFQSVLWLRIILVAVQIAVRMDIAPLDALLYAKQHLAALVAAFVLVQNL